MNHKNFITKCNKRKLIHGCLLFHVQKNVV